MTPLLYGRTKLSFIADKEKRPLFKRPFEELCDTWWCRNYVISVWFQLELQALPPEVLSSELLPQALPALGGAGTSRLSVIRINHGPRDIYGLSRPDDLTFGPLFGGVEQKSIPIVGRHTSP